MILKNILQRLIQFESKILNTILYSKSESNQSDLCTAFVMSFNVDLLEKYLIDNENEYQNLDKSLILLQEKQDVYYKESKILYDDKESKRYILSCKRKKIDKLNRSDKEWKKYISNPYDREYGSLKYQQYSYLNCIQDEIDKAEKKLEKHQADYRRGEKDVDSLIEEKNRFKETYEHKVEKFYHIQDKIYFPKLFTDNGISDHNAFLKSKRGLLFKKIGEVLSDGSPNRNIHRFHTNDPSIAKFIKYFIEDNSNCLILPNTTYEGIISNVFSYFEIPDKIPKKYNIEEFNSDISNKTLDYVFIILKEGQKENPNLISALISIKDGLITRKSSFMSTHNFEGPKVIVFSNEEPKLRSKIDKDTFEVVHYKYFIEASDINESLSL